MAAPQTWEIRRLNESDPLYAEAARRLFGPTGYACKPSESAIPQDGGWGATAPSLELLAAFRHGALKAVVSLSEIPGRAGLVLTDEASLQSPKASRECLALLVHCVGLARDRGCRVLQALVAPELGETASIFASAGFRRLTQLIYMRRPSSWPAPTRMILAQLDWLPYDLSREALFCDAIARTYAQTLDCPELMSLRTVPEVLLSHKAAGMFDSSTWWVAFRDGDPVGVVLVGRHPQHRAAEIVYLGVAQTARGTGVANALVLRAVETAEHHGDITLTLAVDERNVPARRLYGRWGFVEVLSRDAWIATPNGT